MIHRIKGDIISERSQSKNCLFSGDNIRGGNVENPSLTLNHYRETDEGDYECVLVNGAGEARSETVQLVTLGKHDRVCYNDSVYSDCIMIYAFLNKLITSQCCRVVFRLVYKL